jgi:hypothetical protein
MSKPIEIQFGERAVQIFCDDPILRDPLCRYFRHCLRSNAVPIAATFQLIQQGENVWELWIENRLTAKGSLPSRHFEILMGMLVSKLIANSHQQAVYHAGGLAKEGRGLVLCGDSGSGKSTLTAYLVSKGFDYLTDEIVGFSLEGKTVVGLPRPIILKQRPESGWQSWLPPDNQEKFEVFPHGGIWVDPDLFRPGAVTHSAKPAVIFFPRFQSGQGFEWQELSQAETAFELMQRLVNAKNLPNHGFTFTTQLARKIKAYRLTYGEITDEMWRWINEIFVM